LRAPQVTEQPGDTNHGASHFWDTTFCPQLVRILSEYKRSKFDAF